MQSATHGLMRRTKIVATLGPACDRAGVIDQVVAAGVNVVRFDFFHDAPEDHRRRLAAVRGVANRQDRCVAVMADLQGPKVRIARFAEGSVCLEAGQSFILDTELGPEDGSNEQVSCTHSRITEDVAAGDVLLLDKGRLELVVECVLPSKVLTYVRGGGQLSGNTSIHKLGGGLSANSLTDKDRSDIETAIELDVDYLTISFPRNARDIQQVRSLLGEKGQGIRLVAKIERADAVTNSAVLEELIQASDAVMISRGDLGTEVGDAQLVGIQKRIIGRARTLNKLVITATQMMESMLHAPLPTRAEVFDVANAVLDGTDAVMLSAETAIGEYPAEAVTAMNRLCLGAERERAAQQSQHRLHEHFSRINETIALSAMYAANHLSGVVAIACLTETGLTPLIASRIRSGLPIVALSAHGSTLRRTALYRGVVPLPFDVRDLTSSVGTQAVIQVLLKHHLAKEGDKIILTQGDRKAAEHGTDSMKVLWVENRA